MPILDAQTASNVSANIMFQEGAEALHYGYGVIRKLQLCVSFVLNHLTSIFKHQKCEPLSAIRILYTLQYRISKIGQVLGESKNEIVHF